MASNYKLRRFSNPSTLKSISLPLLVQFFWPYREFLAARGFDVSVRQDFDYDELAVILMARRLFGPISLGLKPKLPLTMQTLAHWLT